MAYSNINKMTITNTAIYDTCGLDITLAKTDKNRYYLAKPNGDIIGKGFTSEKLALAKLEKIELRRYNGNLHGLRFGSKINESTIEAYNAEIWGGKFELSNIRFHKDHYLSLIHI